MASQQFCRSERAALRPLLGLQLQHCQLSDQLCVWEAPDLYSLFYADPANCEQLIDDLELAEKRNAPFAQLSDGQRCIDLFAPPLEVLGLVATGVTSRIAATRFISEATVKTHLLHIHAKLGV